MDILIWALFIALIASALVIILAILMQPVKSSGLGATFGGGDIDSFYGKNQGKTREGRAKLLIKVLAVVMVIICITLTVLLQLFTGLAG